MEPLYSIMATCLAAMKNCRNSGNDEWYDVWQEVLNDCVEDLPRGSGFDNYPMLDEEVSNSDKLVFVGAYHPMVDGGYVEWINYRVIVKPSFVTGIRLTVKYVPDSALREYIAECFHNALRARRSRGEMIAEVAARTRQEVASEVGRGT